LRRLILALLAAAIFTGAARAQEPPPPPVEPPRIATGVTVAGVPVGGLTAEEAHRMIRAAFDRRLPFVFGARRWAVRPATLRARAHFAVAVTRALAARPGRSLTLPVRVDTLRVRRYVGYLERVFSRAPRDSVLVGLRGLRPFVTKPRYGLRVRRLAMTNAIVRSLRLSLRTPIRLRVAVVVPRVTRANYGPVVVIRRGSRKLYLYRGMTFVRRFTVAVGMPRYPTPLGRFRVVVKLRNPTWNPPASDWAAGLGPVPPGPANPLGTRWIGLSAPGIGIHGTPQPWTVGTAASHGCIRMYTREVEWLFPRVNVGTPVFVARA
jgi:L,D-transpeptidase catalytic domain